MSEGAAEDRVSSIRGCSGRLLRSDIVHTGVRWLTVAR